MPKGTPLDTALKRQIWDDYTNGQSPCYEDFDKLAEKYCIKGKLSQTTLVSLIYRMGGKIWHRTPAKKTKDKIETTQISPETTILKLPITTKRIVIRVKGEVEIIMEG